MDLFSAVLTGGSPEVVGFWSKAGRSGTTDPRDEALGVGVVIGVVLLVREVRWLDGVDDLGVGFAQRAFCEVLVCCTDFRFAPGSSAISRLRFAR